MVRSAGQQGALISIGRHIIKYSFNRCGGHGRNKLLRNRPRQLGRLVGDELLYAQRINDALAKIRQGAKLAWEEESMIKTLWHEIGHNRQTGLTTRAYAAGSVNEYLLEATNEFVALRTYPQFLRAIGGGDARWKGSVRADSGYLDRVNNLEALLEAVGVYPNDFLAEMERVTFAGPIDDGHGNTMQGNLAEAIAKAGRLAGWKGLSKTKVNAVLKHIQRQDKFSEASPQTDEA